MNVSGRATILFAPFDGWDLQPYQRLEGETWVSGGVRSLLEIAAGVAAIGLDVELRGGFVESEVAAIERAAGVRLGRPRARRRPLAGELVIVPEGHDDPLIFGRLTLSGARAVMVVLAALGLFGWPFDETPIPRADEVLTLDTTTVGRPESLIAARACGLELWTNASAVAEQGASVGVDVRYVGHGRPTPYPESREKSVDVLALAENRWSPLAREALDAVPAQFSRRIQPRGSHAELLAAMSEARVFLHPARIEGLSRLTEEARAMRAVPVLLTSNGNGEGYGPEYGSVVVDSVAEMPAAAAALLNDPERLAELAQNGYHTAREAGDWEAYKQRLRDAVTAPDAVVAAGTYVRAAVGERAAEEHTRLLDDRDAVARDRDAVARDRDGLRDECDQLAADAASMRDWVAGLDSKLDAATAQVGHLNATIHELETSTSWRVTKPLREVMGLLRSLR